MPGRDRPSRARAPVTPAAASEARHGAAMISCCAGSGAGRDFVRVCWPSPGVVRAVAGGSSYRTYLRVRIVAPLRLMMLLSGVVKKKEE
jgi:hypothetical protein